MAAAGMSSSKTPIAPAPPHEAPPPERRFITSQAFAELPGWAADDHLAAFSAFVAACSLQHDPALMRLCARAQTMAHPDEARAREFFETYFRPQPASEPGLLTGYFTPIYEARLQREGEFSAAVRPRPSSPAASRQDRAVIEERPAPQALAWLRPEDLFFLQIQGSGVLVFDDGTRWRAVYDGANGAPFLAIAGPMLRRGLLKGGQASAATIHDWLASHRGVEAARIMDLDRRYVFFRLEPDDGQTPMGAAGVRLPVGRAAAVDPAFHAMGEMFWIDAEAPTLAGAFPHYQRLAVALDTGIAIKGDSRADLYLGEGPEAGLEAGRVRHILRLYRLVPLEPAPP
jgi:membrane-bound lytic murein transglycosylase A